ncbi:MAG: glycosyltransferase family 2 protein [Candidatus Thermoplasmatota archaeon]
MYILVTPAKNEEVSLPVVIEALVGQSVLPLLWVIIDDNSTDSTPKIIDEFVKKYDWVKKIRFDGRKRELGEHYSKVVKKGFEFALEYAKENGMDWKYIGILDADIIPEKRYFGKLIGEMEKNEKIGICAGELRYILGNKIIKETLREDEPTGGARLWSRKCFEETGYSISHFADGESNTKARIKGYETKTIYGASALGTRRSGVSVPTLFTAKMDGEGSYYTGFHPIIVLAKAARYIICPPYYFLFSFAFLFGYFTYFVKRKKTDSQEVLHYNRTIRPKMIIGYYFK